MLSISGILVVMIAVIVWSALKEFPAAAGLLLPTGAMGRTPFILFSVILGAGALLLPITAQLGAGLLPATEIEARQMMLIIMASLLAVLILDRFALIPSVCTAFVGALEGYKLVATDDLPLNAAPVLTWVASLAAVFLLALLLEYALKALFVKSGIHIITLSYWMRPVAAAGMCLGIAAIGINNGAVLHAAAGTSGIGVPVVAAVSAVMTAVLGNALLQRSYAKADLDYELSLHSAASVSLAVTAVLLCFSSRQFCGMLHLPASPLGVQALIAVALLGVSVSRKSFAVEPSAVGKSLAGLILSPALALIIVYFSFSLIRRSDNDSYPIVLLLFLLLAAGMLGLHLFREIRKSREDTEKLLAAKQQQIYENQKALNSMEMKAVLNENEQLHGTLERKRRELIDIALNIGEQKEYLSGIAGKLRRIGDTADPETKDRLLSELEKEIQQRLQNDNRLDDFYAQVESLHKDFSVKLTESFPSLTQQERKLATLLRLGFSTKYIASLMYITPKSVEIERYRLRRKLGLKRSDNLITFIKSI